mmetsp:Transcript_13788/g.30550  ORF Transcript_13788/g.30550 Transcript_13788/m.30550 type:complete len:207 (+) Transcript_13788:418-1038(+)
MLMQTAALEAASAAKPFQASAEAFGLRACAAARWIKSSSFSADVGPHSRANRTVALVDTKCAADFGSITTTERGDRMSRTPKARLICSPSFSRASVRGKDSNVQGRAMVLTASSQIVSACRKSGTKAWSFENFFFNSLAAFSASFSISSKMESEAGVQSTPNRDAAPERVCTSAWSTRRICLQASKSSSIIASSRSLDSSKRAKAY